jgi:hypothetical protein
MSSIVVAAALFLQAGQPLSPISNYSGMAPPVIRTAPINPTESLKKRGFSDAAVTMLVKAAEDQAQARGRNANLMAALRLQLKVATSAVAPSSAHIAALLRDGAALISRDATDRVNRTAALLNALPPPDLKLYLEAFGADEPNLVRLTLPTSNR